MLMQLAIGIFRARDPDHTPDIYTDRNDDDNRAGTKLDTTEEDACTADVSAPQLPPKPWHTEPQVE